MAKIREPKSEMPKKSQRARNWVFTDFESLDFGKIFSASNDIIKFIGWGEEICPKTQKKHNQGWIQMKSLKTLFGMKKLFGTKKLHLEPMRGNPEDSQKYCMKDGKFHSHGAFTQQGVRSSMEEMKVIVDNGGSMMDIATENITQYIQYGKRWEAYKSLLMEEQSRKERDIEVIVHWGVTGTGKTHTALHSEESWVYLIHGSELLWWDKYKGEKTICIDEYANQIPITRLLNLLDRYQCRLPTKGGFTYALWTKVYITTNLSHLHELARSEHQDALDRRITKVIEMTIKYKKN